jgi:hypothetical protein
MERTPSWAGMGRMQKRKERKENVMGWLWASSGTGGNRWSGCTGEEEEWAGVWADSGVFEDSTQADFIYRNTLLIYKHIFEL